MYVMWWKNKNKFERNILFDDHIVAIAVAVAVTFGWIGISSFFVVVIQYVSTSTH